MRKSFIFLGAVLLAAALIYRCNRDVDNDADTVVRPAPSSEMPPPQIVPVQPPAVVAEPPAKSGQDTVGVSPKIEPPVFDPQTFHPAPMPTFNPAPVMTFNPTPFVVPPFRTWEPVRPPVVRGIP
ncbi:MAG: hypothetical protein PHT12_00875 [Patescibacteria group bacterium]|nr:hypothetical protein [Patescibacteria group bacterium]